MSSERLSRRDPLALAVTAVAAVAFAAILVAWRSGGGSFDVPWAPTLGMRLHFSLDGLGVLYALLATGIGAVVFAYGAAYLPLHLRFHDRPPRDHWRFWPWMALFMVSMVGLATAQDLILLFLLFDLTAVCSYFLIGFDRQDRAPRLAALMALLVTGIGAVAMLIGAVILYVDQGTFSIPLLAEEIGAASAEGTVSSATTIAMALIVVAALAKSAQVPLHFWLPRAMAAPTPVSAYLHSAAMVAAGVLVIGRTYQLLEGSQVILDGLVVVGVASIVVGGVLALTRDGFKQVLAHSTISQYGYVVVLYGLGGESGVIAASFYVIAHAIAKSALFLTAGSVTVATGERRLSRVGGLWKDLPGLAVPGAAAAATLSALPLTIGFFKDEFFFHAAAEHSTALAIVSVLAAALTFAYIWRFWGELFLGAKAPARIGRLPRALVMPVVALGLLALAGGIVAGPFTELAGDAASATLGTAVDPSAGYHLDARSENLMALGAWALGLLILLTPRAWRPAAQALSDAGDRFGPSRLYEVGLSRLNRVSDVLHDIEVRDVRSRVVAVLLPGGLLVAFGFAATPTEDAFSIGSVSGSELLVVALLALIAVAALVVANARGHVATVLSLAVVGLGLATVYALLGAPDVALVAVLVETVVTLVFLAIVAYVPRGERPSRFELRSMEPRSWRRLTVTRRWRDPLIGIISGAAAFVVVWSSLSRPAAVDRVFRQQVELTPEAHGRDVVTVILADFRGLDTLVEITVILVAIFGVIALLRRGRTW